jgi:hypothetical protein
MAHASYRTSGRRVLDPHTQRRHHPRNAGTVAPPYFRCYRAVTRLDCADEVPVPIAFTAATVNR